MPGLPPARRLVCAPEPDGRARPGVTDGVPSRAFRRRADDAVLLASAAVVLTGFVLVEHRLAGTVGLPLDDGWIHLRVATNLAHGRGFGINPGEPLAVSTAPLWTLGLAGAIRLGLPGLVATKILGVAGYLGTALLTRRAALAVGAGRGAALAAALGAVGLGRLAWGALSGMEVPLAAALVAGAVLAVLRMRPWLASLLLGLATLARPEAGLFVALHGVAAGRVRAGLGRVALAGLVLAPAVAFNLATTGRVVPLPAAAKVEGGLLGRAEGLSGAWRIGATRTVAYLGEWIRLLLADHWALPVLLAVGLIVLFRRRSALRWLGLALVLHPLATAVVAPYRGPAFQTGRYSSHLLPLALVVGAAGLSWVLTTLRAGGRGALGAAPAPLPGDPAAGATRTMEPPRLAAATLMVVLALGLVGRLGPAARAYGWGVQNIDAMQVALGRWVARETPPDALVAVNDIGALSYFGDRRILDLMGLATPAVLPYRRAGPAGVTRFVEARCPDYVVIFPEWFPELAARDDLLFPVTRVRLAHNAVAGGVEMAVYETVWRRERPGRRPCGETLAQAQR